MVQVIPDISGMLTTYMKMVHCLSERFPLAVTEG